MNALQPRSSALFAAVADLTGIAPLLARGLLRRALLAAGVDELTARVDDYARALPKIAARMRAYLPAEEVERRLRDLERLVRRAGLCDPGGSTRSDP
jgi:hypothetical protein